MYVQLDIRQNTILMFPFRNSRFGHQSPVTSIDALAREKAITSGGMDRSIRIWKIPEESQLVFNGHHGNIECVKLINEENFV
jgi:ribosomal RNA-processing protein 9